MSSILLFAFALAVAGGVIAYIGDRLGTYVGKKRISLIGLRPRHTATLYTTVSGGIIAVLTLLFLISFDRTFQRALLEGPQLLFENSQYRREIKVERANAKNDQDRAVLAQSQLELAKSQLLPIHQQLLSAESRLQSSQAMLGQRQKELGAAQEQLAGVRNSLNSTNGQLRLARRDYQQARQALGAAKVSVSTAEAEVLLQQKHVRNLTETGQKLFAQNTRLRGANSHLKTQSSLLAGRVEASGNPVIFRTAQELDRLVVRTAQPVSTIVNQLDGFLDSLSRTAEDQGGKHGVNNRAVVVAVPIGAGGYKPLKLTEEGEAIKTLAQNIAAQSPSITSVVVIARATTNTFYGEQTSIDLSPYDNILIYSKDASIATGTIDGSQSPLEIVDALGTFLTKKVRPTVSHQGLIPHTDPQTGKPVVGAVLDEATSQSLVQQIERIGGPVQVTAFASEDTYSSGPLHLRLSVSPLAAGATPPAGNIPSGRRS